MKILGVQQPDEGTIAINGRPRVLPGHRCDPDRHRHGLPALHALYDNLTVLENVVLGAEKLHGIGDAARAEIGGCPASTASPSIRTSWPIWGSVTGSGSRSSRCSSAARDPDPGRADRCVLVPQEFTELFGHLRELKAEGLTVIFISLAWRCWRSPTTSTSPPQHHRRGGRAVQRDRPPARQRADGGLGASVPADRGVDGHRQGDAGAEGRQLAGSGLAKVLDGVSLVIHAGEILGITWRQGATARRSWSR